MDIDPSEVIERAATTLEIQDARARRLNAVVAVTVAIIATFMGICKVKDDNIVQAMQQAQADKIDHWSYFQAKNIRADMAAATAVQLELAKDAAVPAAVAKYDKAIADYRELHDREVRGRDELKVQAEHDQHTYDNLNYRDDQFDLSDALLAIAIALLAVTALTGFWALYWVGLVPIGSGVLMGLAGLLELPIHPDALVRLLS
ncbi:DUF4337 domain-containing protein [Azoarcus sp. KH32C]|uniref:DUF4337 domain-containing protein n=1 Tax=Azoarcus sp. KH32C TaxID=748247 RepID=UPI0002385BA0|nr:DUF4337 domain-containing protein [Azoarcus sp. KH32C]BAL27283.1 hypothetical protein AZKH_p0400 [Azoarcus sp. KH32C]